MGLRDIESTLPPGFRFFPSDEELVCHYLYKKVANQISSGDAMVEVDLHTCEPWELPEVAKLRSNDWYFFSFRDRKYATGSRMNRATKCGYWKATGKDRPVHERTTHAVMGMRKTLVFYRGRAPNGVKTNWVMHEFRLHDHHRAPPKEDWVLCRVFRKKKGINNPTSYMENNEQYGYYLLDSSSPPPPLPPPPPPPPPLLHDEHPMAVDEWYEQTQMNCSIPGLAENNSSKSIINLALWRCNLFDFPQEVDEAGGAMVGLGAVSSSTDHNGLLLDMSLQEEDHHGSALMGSLAANVGYSFRFQGGGKDQLLSTAPTLAGF